VDDLTGVKILWDDSIHDGETVSGFAEYQGRAGYFQAVFDELQDDYEYPRRLVLYALSDDEVAYERRKHKAWERMGSTKNCHHPDVPSPPERTESSLAQFYSQFPPHPLRMYEDHPVIGWFWAAEG
jgi:hypothetical protein